MAEESWKIIAKRSSDLNVKKYMIDAEEFLAWCRELGKPNDSSSRAEFVSQKVHAEHASSNLTRRSRDRS